MRFSLKKSVFLTSFFLSILCCSLSHATVYSFDDALAQYKAQALSQPKPEADGRIQTLNKKGAASPQLDEATSQFIEFSNGKKVLEIGGAYGRVMLETLSQYPSTIYHLNDLDERHLFIAAKNLDDAKFDKPLLKQMKFIADDITQATVLKDKYDAILIARVLHFFSPEQLEAAMINLHHSLKPNGRIYVVAITPYVRRYQNFITEYERRVANHEAYPGYVTSLKDWVNHKVTTPAQIATIHDKPFMFLDDRVLKSSFEKHGFRVLEAKTMPLRYHSLSWSLDGRENVILIAEKVEDQLTSESSDQAQIPSSLRYS